LNIVPIYPHLFRANSESLALAEVRRIGEGGTSVEYSTAIDSLGRIVANPIDLGPDTDRVLLALFGTGLGQSLDAPAVTAAIDGSDATISYAGAQGEYRGVFEVDLVLPRTLVGRGRVQISVSAGGIVSNPVYLWIR
jgi:uncharacterized protein (TIGR03437 family)